ncbi:sugar ABC transporter ATP-binding protein [Roseicyclus mahoneyensis]|uniref:Monosaccharide ABC transporter ATP-binding protein (CUT2 family) n=1 Tax=Roseicyclus mahoneyensis TaxID=164332 RepID=A0A316GII2_9RHOB|nr:sugar ABC transporter ATP-binding protein [Roseicyclus mahoneyensis]PWK60590.1 monosaccharide ABC transporter ATP-binding protein (CUT2 family) [Roseicyclus mahoneyensis]
MTDTPLLDARGVAKSYGAVKALTGARLTVARGEIVALMGANGAGKSTFVKILTGAVRPDTGIITIAGRSARMGSPAQARRAGLVPVYQEPSLIPDLDVAANLRLCDTPVAAFVGWVADLGITGLRLTDLIADLPLATLRILDLARALASDPDVLLLDEMTAALPTDLVENVLRVVRARADLGMGVIYVSHRFTEISALCDRATVLRDGRTVGDLRIEPGVEDRAVELMLGEKIALGAREGAAISARTGTPRLAIRNLAAAPKLADVSFDLHAGEVLGVVALEGQGQDELFDVLAGFRKSTAGTLEIDGQPARFAHPSEAIAAGLTYVPGNRADALMAGRSVRENIALPFSARPRNWGPIKRKMERARTDDAIARLQIDTRAQGEVQRLSGGNQQKVTIGRWLATGVQTLLLFDPTRGIDVRTKRQIYPLVRELAEQGAAVLFYTSELAEVRLACDRAIVIFNGRVVDIIDAARADEPTLMRAAYGLTAAKGAA